MEKEVFALSDVEVLEKFGRIITDKIRDVEQTVAVNLGIDSFEIKLQGTDFRAGRCFIRRRDNKFEATVKFPNDQTEVKPVPVVQQQAIIAHELGHLARHLGVHNFKPDISFGRFDERQEKEAWEYSESVLEELGHNKREISNITEAVKRNFNIH